MPITKTDQPKYTGLNNDAGLASEIYIGEAGKVLNWPARIADPTSFAHLATLEGDIKFVTGERFYSAYTTPETGKMLSKMAGERDGRSGETLFDFFVPGIAAEQIGFVEYYKNKSIVAVAKDLEGAARMLGDQLIPCEIVSFEMDTMDVISGRKGTKFQARMIGRIAPFYAGYIQMKATLAALTRSIAFYLDGTVAADAATGDVLDIKFLSTTPDATFDSPTVTFLNSIPTIASPSWYAIDPDDVLVSISAPVVGTPVALTPGWKGLQVRGSFATTGDKTFTVRYSAKNLLTTLSTQATIEITA
jgi:hypothetical protein